jgi:hypothetical protein
MKLYKTIITLSILILNIICLAQFAGGSGTIEDPYQIATADHLNNIRYNLTASYIQTADIDLGVAPWNVGAGWDPIGDYDPWDPSKSFRGNYDGNGYSINNMFIERLVESNLGLFGSILGCKINNVRLINFLIHSEQGYLGGLSGIAYENNISNCYAEGKIQGYSQIGLLFGFFEQYSISNCHVKGEITATGSNIGGLVGLCSITDLVTDCSSEVKLYADRLMVGGIFGMSIALGVFSKNSSNCEIVAAGEAAGCSGGLIGSLNPSLRNCFISECYSIGSLIAKYDVVSGGLIGEIFTTNDSTIINNSYSKVNVQGNKAVGGFVGFIDENATIKNCYSTGLITGNSNIGGFIGKIDSLNTVIITNSYWDMETSGQTTSAAGEGRTTTDMTVPVYGSNTYVGWDFGSVWADDIYNLNEGYPRLEWTCGIEDNDDAFVAGERGFELYQNYPNPFNPVTQIKFALSKSADVKLYVYNMAGQKVVELVNGKMKSGFHTVFFDGEKLNSGVYYYVLEVEGITQSRRMLLIK